jgi:enolase-phosphatase E1
MKIEAILTDIEGTTSSIAFVTDTLFPFAKARLAGFVASHRDHPEVKACLDGVRAELGRPDAGEDDLLAALIAWIDQDRKVTPLKTLQGMIWAEGYADGSIKGHVYPDAAQALRRWHGLGIRLYVYSSGSVAAQKLIFGHTAYGDLTSLFAGYFDTRTGPKRDPESYRRIAIEIGLPVAEILFLSDSAAELDAARAAGLLTICLDRGEAVIPPDIAHPRVSDFAAIAAQRA